MREVRKHTHTHTNTDTKHAYDLLVRKFETICSNCDRISSVALTGVCVASVSCLQAVKSQENTQITNASFMRRSCIECARVFISFLLLRWTHFVVPLIHDLI